jgi:hypothetical protein
MSFQFNDKVSLIYKKLKRGDYEIKPYRAYKKWKFSTETSVSSNTLPRNYESLGMKVYRSLYPENHKYFGAVANLSSSLYQRVFTTQSVDPMMIWYYLDHTFYTNFYPDKLPSINGSSKTLRTHYESGSVFIVPQRIFGEGIKRGSFELNHYGLSSEYNYVLKDDSIGNLIDQDYDTTKFPDESRCLMYVGFNEKYREYKFRNKQVNTITDDGVKRSTVEYVSPKLVSFAPGIPTTSPVSSSGTCAQLNGGYFKVVEKENFNFNNRTNFAISLWLNVPTTQSNIAFNYNQILDKRTRQLSSVLDRKTGQTSNELITRISPNYPFDIAITNYTHPTPHKILFSQSSGVHTANVTSSISLTPGQWYHVLCQKSGSNYGIYIDGVLDSSVTTVISDSIVNNHEMHIGGNGTSNGILSGSLDEFRIYNTALTTNQIAALADNSYDLGYAYATNIVGNVFYEYGIAVISDPRPKYWNTMLGRTGNYDYYNLTDGFDGSFRTTTTFYEHEVICRLKKNEFNFSTNPSLRKDNDPYTSYPKDFVTSSFFNPYITTIGLYNDNSELVAVAKLANPVEKRDDVDMNIIIRWDV